MIFAFVIAQMQIFKKNGSEDQENPPHELKYCMVFNLATTQVQKLNIPMR